MCTKLADLLLKCFDRDRTRTCNPQIRSLVPYPLGHTTCFDNGWIFFFATLRAENGGGDIFRYAPDNIDVDIL